MSAPFEPVPSSADLLTTGASWEQLDERLTGLVGRPALAVPSIRVGMWWILEHLGLRRNEHEVLVPRFVGRCILDALARAAQPAYECSPRTRAAVLVHFFGKTPNWAAVRPELERRRLPFLEDSPDGLHAQEGPTPGSLGKFIALSKLLPMLKGGCLLTDEPVIAELIKRKRRAAGPLWARAFVAGALIANRMGRPKDGAASLEAAYTLYPHTASDSFVLRGLFMKALDRAEAYSRVETARLERLEAALAGRVLAPDARKLMHYVPVLPADGAAGQVTLDLDNNPFEPRFQKVCLIGVHPQVGDAEFESSVAALKSPACPATRTA